MHGLRWLAAYAIVVGLLCIGVAVQEWWLWRREERKRATSVNGKPQTRQSGNGTRN